MHQQILEHLKHLGPQQANSARAGQGIELGIEDTISEAVAHGGALRKAPPSAGGAGRRGGVHRWAEYSRFRGRAKYQGNASVRPGECQVRRGHTGYASSSLTHGVGHFWPRSMMAESSSGFCRKFAFSRV